MNTLLSKTLQSDQFDVNGCYCIITVIRTRPYYPIYLNYFKYKINGHTYLGWWMQYEIKNIQIGFNLAFVSVFTVNPFQCAPAFLNSRHHSIQFFLITQNYSFWMNDSQFFHGQTLPIGTLCFGDVPLRLQVRYNHPFNRSQFEERHLNLQWHQFGHIEFQLRCCSKRQRGVSNVSRTRIQF